MNNLKALEQKHAELGEEIKKLKQAATVSYKRPRVAKGESYFHSEGDGGSSEIKETKDGYDQRCYDIGNYFLTEEEAERARARQLAYVRMTDAIREANAGWVVDVMSSNQVKYYVYLYEGDVGWNAGYSFIYFPIEMFCSKKAREKLGDSLNEDLKIWMGIE